MTTNNTNTAIQNTTTTNTVARGKGEQAMQATARHNNNEAGTVMDGCNVITRIKPGKLLPGLAALMLAAGLMASPLAFAKDQQVSKGQKDKHTQQVSHTSQTMPSDHAPQTEQTPPGQTQQHDNQLAQTSNPGGSDNPGSSGSAGNPGAHDNKDTAHENKHAKQGQDGDDLPTITLSAPADNTANLYPAAFTVDATVVFPGKAGWRRDKRRGVEVEFLADGKVFAEDRRPPYEVSYIPKQAGIHTLTARIHFGRFERGHRYITSSPITVIADVPPQVSLTAPAANTIQTAPATFNLAANASAPIGSIAQVEFYAATTDANGNTTNTLVGTATTGTNGAYSYTWSNVPWGTYSVTAKATDNYGFSTTTAPVTVISNEPPTVSITNPADNTVLKTPANHTVLTASAADIDGTIAKVDFYAATTDASGTTTNTLVGSATTGSNGSYSFNWNSIPVGQYTLTSVATDNYGASTTSSPIHLTIKPGELVAYFIQTDQNNTPRKIVDDKGNVVWENNDPFGNAPPITNPSGQGSFDYPLRFPGQYFDKETNTNYNINRDYNPAIGRYIESDPIGLDGGINTFAYAEGNPLSKIDPTGLKDYIGQCKGRYSGCAASQTPSKDPFWKSIGTSTRNWGAWRMCKKGVDRACSNTFPHCCDIDYKNCMSKAGTDADKINQCRLQNILCVAKGR